MGGHLRKVETSEGGVTWGVGADSTPWAYTGGWGGSVLGGKRNMYLCVLYIILTLYTSMVY